MVFDEYIGHTFVYIAMEEIELMRRTAGVCVSIVRHVCGPDIAVLVFAVQTNKSIHRNRIVDAHIHTHTDISSLYFSSVTD